MKQERIEFLSAGVQKGIFARVQKGTNLVGVFCEDFGPVIEGWCWWLSDHPEVSEGMVDQGDGGSFGGRDVPALAEEIDLAVSVDASFQMQRQMEVQQGGRRTGTGGDAFIFQGFLPRCIGAEAGGAADGVVLPLTSRSSTSCAAA